jgi:hypothetical protein
MTYVGIDVSKASLEVATLAVTGEVQHAKFENTAQGHDALLGWLGHLPDNRVVVEATATYHRQLTSTLQGHGVYVSGSSGILVQVFARYTVLAARLPTITPSSFFFARAVDLITNCPACCTHVLFTALQLHQKSGRAM